MTDENRKKQLSRRGMMQLGAGTLLGTAGLSSMNSSTVSKAADAVPESKRASVLKTSKKKDWRSKEFGTMVALGESTTAGGWSTSRERCWVSVLTNLIDEFQAKPLKSINAGIGANVISTKSPSYQLSGKPAALERLDKHVIVHRPDLLLVSYGLNDCRGNTPLPLFTRELTALVRNVRKQADPVIVLLGPYYMNDFALGGKTWSHGNLRLFHKFNKATAEVAVAEECLYADILSANGGTDWMVHYDGVHANDLGHRIVANRVFEVLAGNCSCLSKTTKAAEKTSPRWRDESTLKSDYGF